mgnify:CR=1 FL=1
MDFLDSPRTRERRYRVNRTSQAHPLNMPRGLPLMPHRSVYVQEMPVGLQVFNRIHNAVAAAERRLLMTPDEDVNQSHIPNPITMFGGTENPQQPQQQNPGMYGLLPRTQAPIEFECGVCFEKIRKGQPQQLLNCGHKFCGSCFDKWHAQSGNTTCPSCRTPVHTSSMQHQPMGQMGRGRHTPIRIQTTSRFSGSQGMTPQQQAMAMFMRSTQF